MKKIKFCLVLIVGLIVNGVPSLVLAVESPIVPKLQFTSLRVGNIFPGESGELTLTISDPDRVDGGEVALSDEMGSRLGTLSILKGVSVIQIPLPKKGFYNVTASVRLMNGLSVVQNSTAAVIGAPLSEKEGILSHNGVWNVHGSLDLAQVAGSSWERKMWRVVDYKRDATGAIIPIPKLDTLDKRFFWIGTMAWGIPSWIEGKPSNAKFDDLFPLSNWGQLDALAKQFARDVKNFPPVFELYNEPEIHWAGKFDPKGLVKFHAVLAQAIKSVHPDTKVVGPCFWYVNIPQLKELVNAGLLNYLDGISLHGYVDGATAPEGVFIERIVELKNYLHSLGKDKLPLYLTEFGWSTGYGGKGPFTHVDELTQAQYVSRALALLSTQNFAATLHFALQFNSKNDTEGNSSESGFSFLRQDQTPKPAYVAYANTSKWLTATSNPAWSKLSPTMHLLSFTKGADQVIVVWDAAREQNVYFPQIASRAEGMMGQPLPLGGTMLLSPSPIFLKLQPKFTQPLVVKPVVKVGKGDVITLNYEQLWLPAEIIKKSDGKIGIPLHAEKGMYMIFMKRGDVTELLPVSVGN